MPYEFKSIYYDYPIVTGRVLDIFMPAKVTRDVAIYMVHGGGWTGGARWGWHTLMEAFNKEGYIVAANDYRLTGASIPDKLTDCRHGYDLFVSFLKQQNRPLRIATHGGSAGAHLNALMCFAPPGACGDPIEFRDFRPQNPWIPPVAVTLQATPTQFEPWEDMFPHIWTAMQSLVGVPYDKDPQAYKRLSPIEYIDRNSPPVFFQEAEDEHIFPQYIVDKFVEKMRAHGRRADLKVYPRVEHGFIYELVRWQQKEAFADILKFIESAS